MSENETPDKTNVLCGTLVSLIENITFSLETVWSRIEIIEKKLNDIGHNVRKPYKCPVCEGDGLGTDWQCVPCSGDGIVWG